MPGENEAAAPAAEPHATDDIPVEVRAPEPLIVAKEQPAEPVEAPAAEAAPDPAAPPADGAGKPPKLPEWAQKKLNAAEAEKRIADREVKRLADELAALKAPKAEPAAATPADDAAARAGAPAGGYKTKTEFDAAVLAEANAREANSRAAAARASFDAKSNTTFQKGGTEFGDGFKDAISNLHQVGLLPYADPAGNVHNNEILEMVLATDAPEKVLYELGSDPDRAAAIVAMSPQARAIEIAKLSLAAPKKATPAALSNAPRPITPVDGSARVSAAPSDNDDDETFFRKREAELNARL